DRPLVVELVEAQHGVAGPPRGGAGGGGCRRRRAERFAPARGPRAGVPRPATLSGRHGARRPVLPRAAAGGGLARAEAGRGADAQTTCGTTPPPTTTPHGAPAIRPGARATARGGTRGADAAEPHHARGDDRRGAAPPLGGAARRDVRG